METHLKNPPRFALYATLLLLTVQPAFANNPPGPMVMLPEILLLPLMMLLTAIGGGYAILRQFGAPRLTLTKKIILAVVAVVLSGAHEGFGVIVAVLFGAIAATRALRMLSWGLKTSQKNPAPELSTANAPRLLIAGASLLLLSLFVTGMAMASVGYYGYDSHLQTRREQDFKEFVAFQLAYARREESSSRPKSFYKLNPNDRDTGRNLRWAQTAILQNLLQIEYADSPPTFTAYLTPGRFPIFPYNYFTSQPTYRADQSGQIKMQRVHNRAQRCPPEAPVVMQITDQELKTIMDNFDDWLSR